VLAGHHLEAATRHQFSPGLRVCDGLEAGVALPERIGQVLRNLLSNAAKYSPEGTPIELRVIGK